MFISCKESCYRWRSMQLLNNECNPLWCAEKLSSLLFRISLSIYWNTLNLSSNAKKKKSRAQACKASSEMINDLHLVTADHVSMTGGCNLTQLIADASHWVKLLFLCQQSSRCSCFDLTDPLLTCCHGNWCNQFFPEADFSRRHLSPCKWESSGEKRERTAGLFLDVCTGMRGAFTERFPQI